MQQVVALGEILMRFAMPRHTRFVQTLPGPVEANFTGAEANVAAAIAALGGRSRYVTALPNHEIADRCVAYLQSCGIDTQGLVRTPQGRIGTFYFENGIGQRAGNIIYDREHSAIALASAHEFDWEAVFADTDWLFVSGITPAISQTACELTHAAMREASVRNIRIAFDVNFRSKLWNWQPGLSPTQLAQRELPSFVKQADLLFCGLNDAVTLLQYDKDLPLEQMLRQLASDNPQVKFIAGSNREVTAEGATLYGGQLFESATQTLQFAEPYRISSIVDRLGVGDAFAAGLLFCLCAKLDANLKNALQFAAATGCLAHTIEGDFTFASQSEVESLVSDGEQFGRVRR